MFRVKPLVTLGLVFFSVLIHKSEKQWKFFRDCLENLPTGIPSGHQSDDPWEFPRANFSRQPLRNFHCLYQTYPVGRISLVFETHSLTNSGKALGIVCKAKVRSLRNSDFPSGLPSWGKSDYPWDLPRANFSRQPLLLFHCLTNS